MKSSSGYFVFPGFAGMALLLLSSAEAAACNRIDGCTREVTAESYEMMHDGRMAEGMRAGQANIDAFRRMQEAGQAPAARRPRARSR